MTAPATDSRQYTGQSPISAADLSIARHSTRAKKFRDTVVVHDSFRREYTATLDAGTRGIVEIFPTVPAPVNVPLQYVSIPERMPWRLEIDWARYVGDLKRAEREWLMLVDRIMKDLYRESADKHDKPTDRALKMAGTRPQDWRVVAMAAKGDPWALGLQEERTRRIVAVIGAAPWMPAQQPLAVGDDFGLDEEFGDLMADPSEPLVAAGYTDEVAGPVRRTAPAVRRVVGPPALPGDDEEFDLDGEGIGEDDVRAALADDDDAEPLVDVARVSKSGNR